MIRVIGVGTRRGDDRAGLETIEQLAGVPLPTGIELRTCERPGANLLDAMSGAGVVILVDATRPAGSPGTVRRLTPDELRRSEALSSHGFSVAESLALAEALGRLPARVELIGIEAERVDASPGGLSSDPVRLGVAEAARIAVELLLELGAATQRQGPALSRGGV